MKKNYLNPGFTLVELIVVTSIIILLSSSGVLYFSKFTDGLKMKRDVGAIEITLKELDRKVKNKEIFDYEVHFRPGTLGFYYYENIFDLENSARFITPTITSLTGELKLSDTPSLSFWKIFVYSGNKSNLTKTIDSNLTFSFPISNYSNYNLNSSLSGSVINNVIFDYFSKSNLDKQKQDFLFLDSILDENSTLLGGEIIIKNIGGRKTIGNRLQKIVLIFDNNGRQEKITIKN